MLVFGLLSAFPVIYVMIVHEASAGRALLLLIPAALIVAVAIGLAYQPLIEPYHKYRKIMKYGTEYEATVIGVLSGVAKKPDQWVISDNGSSYSLKVTAQINGRETDVILRLPADTPVQECPVGSRIKIKGITDKENGKEYNDFVLV